MAEIRSIYTNNRTDGKTERRTTYVDGAAVRKLRAGEQPERRRRQEDRFSVHTVRRVKAKERMGHMSIPVWNTCENRHSTHWCYKE